LQKEVISYLNPKTNENFIDCTVDGGGHTRAILEKMENKGRILGIDADPIILKETEDKLKEQKVGNRVSLVCDNFSNLKEIAKKAKFQKVNGILFDLGLSSWHLEASGRGFTFLRNEPLDMRYNPGSLLSAEKILNFWSEPEIERILRDFGEEKFSREIATEIIKDRNVSPIKTTFQLIRVIRKAVPYRFQHQKIHFATRTFQAIRIAVNDELESLKKGLSQAIEILDKGGRIVVISFHSLEDRIVKNFLKERENELQILTKKPVVPQIKEIKINPRSRSSKLRAAIKL
ncbi:MAG: 16S rRNA (cytosine(1402)-N(4))-methyltransferase RsmH, partial [Candidatus Omnitrophica bacterium]|nr:16S rRNA (cytosine(1402)-N(4))-methyltransferase RsmH [Candidatus Omnitrophota bacterium]